MKRMGDKREMTPSNTSAISQINEIVKGLGFKQEELNQAKQDLSHFMPKEVFFDKFGNEKGWSLLYAIYAPQIVNDFFKEERGIGEKRQNPKSRRIQYEELAGDPMDYVQSVFMGYHDDQDIFKGGVRSVALPSSSNSHNPYAYDPTMKDSRKSECPHCKSSFWPTSAGNCDPKYRITNGKPLREWRGSADQAPEHIKFNPTTGERQEDTGYSYCGGRHKIHNVTAPDGTVNVEAAEKLSGLGWDELRQQDRVRTTAKDGSLQHYLVDEYLSEVERLLGGRAAYMKFSDEWVFEDGGVLYRECRHPIALKTPASVIHDRISRYTFNISEKKSSGRVQNIAVYLCPKCPGEFKDTKGITSKKGEDRIVDVQCDECGAWFNVDELPADHISSMPWMSQQTSLNVSMPGEEGHLTEMVDNVGCRDIGFVEVEMAEIFDVFDKEIAEISKSLNVRGAEYSKEILTDWIINGLSFKDITEKYLAGIYKLHYTECADCGYTESEKPDPDESQKARYDQGLPVVLVQCPRRLSHPSHKVNLPEQAPAASQNVGEEEWVPEQDLHEELSTNRPEEAVQKKNDAEVAASIQDDDQRRRYLGTNLIYHGDSRGSGRSGISYQVLDIERGIVQELPPTDPKAYKGDNGAITRYIYHPAKRLIDAILNALKENPKIRDRHQDALDILDEWTKRIGEASTRFAKVKSFCRPNQKPL